MKTLFPLTAAALLLGGCAPATKPSATSHGEPPASVQNKVAERDLTRVKLTGQAEQRLGLELAPVTAASSSGQMSVIGDIVPIPGRSIVVSAPASGVVSRFQVALTPGMQIQAGQALFQLTPQVAAQRDLKLTLQADLDSAQARLENATKQAARAHQLLRDLAGSQRNVDTAEQELGQAKAAYDVAMARIKRLDTAPLDADVDIAVTAPSSGILRQLQVAQGQMVTAGAAMLELSDFSRVWLRVPVYVGQLKDLQQAAVIRIKDADGVGSEVQGRRVEAPPSADPLSATADLYYEIENPRNTLRPGQRMMAILPTRGEASQALAVPRSAILYDVHGDAWVYVSEGDHHYRRQRVEVLGGDRQRALISRGLSASMQVVTTGAAELFGTEFGAGH